MMLWMRLRGSGMCKSEEAAAIDEIKDFLVGCKPPEPLKTPEEKIELSLVDALIERIKDIEEELGG